ncbi:MAG: TIGR00269 family protein [Thaumarchaeota archaeon]|nr:TIGR00269 family protein [Nitrososphaerota archaeon]|tara:strand:- start:182 stop:1099 length:918 start_codon:yes stop_codon:yes gene_type:complete
MKVICDRCDRKSAYYKEYSGESLCGRCFSESLREKVTKTISKYSMLKYGDKIAIAVSGGKDSLSLLQIMITLCKKRCSDICVITIDEGIEGYRDESLDIVKKFALQMNVEYKILSYKELYDISLEEGLQLRKNMKMSSCSICGTFRRRAIDIAAESVQANVVATAHNLDDVLQTFLINILAGDVERIGWIYPEPVTYANNLRKIKPLTEIYEYEIAFYALVNEIPFQSETCPHMNEGIRTEIREFLNKLEKGHSGIKYNAYNTMIKIAKRIKESSDKEHNRCILCGKDSTNSICSVCNIVTALKQ